MSLTRVLNAFSTKTGTYIIVPSDDVVLANGTFTVYLPPAANARGRSFTVKNINTGTVTLSANGAELIDGTNTLAIAPNESVIVSCTGAKYHSLSSASSIIANTTVNGAVSTANQSFAGNKTFTGTVAIDTPAGAFMSMRAAGSQFGAIGSSGVLSGVPGTHDLVMFAETGRRHAFWTNGSSVDKFSIGLNGELAGVGNSFLYVPPGTNTLSAAAASMINGQVLILGAGTYTQTTTVEIPAGVTNFSILGQGSGVTIINYTTNDVDGIRSGGIGVNDSYRVLGAVIRGFTMTYSVGMTASTAAAIYLWGHEYDIAKQVGINIDDVSVTYGSVANCWFSGLNIVNARVVYINNFFMRREDNGRTGYGILLQSCMNSRITNSFIMCVARAVSLDKAIDALIYNSIYKHGCEDISITNLSTYIVGYGVVMGYKCFATKINGLEVARPSEAAICEDISLGAENGGYHFIDHFYVDVDDSLNVAAVGHLVWMRRTGSILRSGQITIGGFAINGITLSGVLNTVSDCIFRFSGYGGATGIYMVGNVNKATGNVFETSYVGGADIYITGTGCLATSNMLDTVLTDAGSGNVIANNPVH